MGGGGWEHDQGSGLRVLNVQALKLILDFIWLQVLKGLDLGSEVGSGSLGCEGVVGEEFLPYQGGGRGGSGTGRGLGAKLQRQVNEQKAKKPKVKKLKGKKPES